MKKMAMKDGGIELHAHSKDQAFNYVYMYGIHLKYLKFKLVDTF